MLTIVKSRMEGLGLHLDITQEALEKLAEAGFDPVYGARPLRRTVQSTVEDAVAEAMLSGDLKEGDTAEAVVEDGEVVIRKAG